MQSFNSNRAVLVYEDRPSHEIGMKLLILSLEEHWPDVDVHVFAPNATDHFQEWIRNYPVFLHTKSPTQAQGWNVKPDLLLWGLDQGYTRSIWIDSDIILVKSLPKTWLNQDDNVLIVCQLPQLSKTHDRTIPWKLEPGRSFTYNPSGCFIQVTKAHKPLLQQWKEMLQNPEYKYWQSQPRKQRPIYAFTDDSLLIALLGSKNYENTPLKFLKHGLDIAQCVTPETYSVKHRLISSVYGLPTLVHAMGKKPWLATGTEKIYQSISPYSCIARRYRKQLDANQDWLKIPNKWQKILAFMTRDNPALTSIPFLIGLKFTQIQSKLIQYRTEKLDVQL